jgi:SSS family solute:Na+ symporter
MCLRKELLLARVRTLTFLFMILIIMAFCEDFAGVIGLIIIWFAALVSSAAVPMILSLIPAFKHSSPEAAIPSIVTGVLGFVMMKLFANAASQAMILVLPTILSVIVYEGVGPANRKEQVPEDVELLFRRLSLANIKGQLLAIPGDPGVIAHSQRGDILLGGK